MSPLTLCCSLLLCAATAIHGHIVLTYPPARKYALDFLDNTRTKGPCGMSKGKGPTTDLLSESSFNVTWFMAYAHDGGYKLEILEGATVKHTLTTPAGFVGVDTKYVSKYAVTLPTGYTCSGCTLRLQRQATEWGGSYTFWSCADVNILATAKYTRSCSGHGTFSAADDSCTCSATYKGKECQYKNECEQDSDCSSYGECITTDSTFYPIKQCYCKPGWFGRKCNKESSVKTMTIDEALYTKKTLKSGLYEVLYRKVEDEVEIVIKAKTTSFVAIGWRPLGGTAGGTGEPTAQPTGEPKGEPTTEPESTPEPAGEPTGEPTGEPAGEPAGKGLCDPKAKGLHPMDCTDIVIGTARGDLSRIADYFTLSRATPKTDDFFDGGDNSLTAAIGSESDGTTTILFRRLLKASEKQDHTIEGKAMHVIWAVGQANKDNYKDDQLKYHGSNKGKTEFAFYIAETGTSNAADSRGSYITVFLSGLLLMFVRRQGAALLRG